MLLYIQKNTGKIYSLLIVFLFVLFFPFIANAATLSISPASGNFEVGQPISVKIFAASSGTPFNAVSGIVSFPTSIFTIESVSKAGSVLDFWVSEPLVSKTAGTVKFEGVSLGGAGRSSGTVITINLRAKSVGIGKAFFQSGQILANDGEGTDITGAMNGADYSVTEATPAPEKPQPKPTPKPTPTPEPEKEVVEPVQPPPTLKAPEIMLGIKHNDKVILGTSDYPNSEALVTFTAQDSTKVFIMGVADSKGEFVLTVPSSLKIGTYTVNAVMIKQDKTNSEISNTITVKIGDIFSNISWWLSLIIFILILLVIYLILRIHYHFRQNISRNIKHKISVAENVMHKSFDIIREDVIDYDNKKLTATEHRRMAGIKKDIIDAEKIIDKEIKDIGS